MVEPGARDVARLGNDTDLEGARPRRAYQIRGKVGLAPGRAPCAALRITPWR